MAVLPLANDDATSRDKDGVSGVKDELQQAAASSAQAPQQTGPLTSDDD
jgi:hypothetical protein